MSILTYHSIDNSGSVISTTPERFASQMEQLARSSATVVPLTTLVESLRSGAAHSINEVAITFDDGFTNFYTEAYPVLKRFGFAATVYVVAGRCGSDNRWEGQPKEIPTLELMDWAKIKSLASDGVDIGAHTMTHPDLTSLTPEEAEREMIDSASVIEEHTGARVENFAYPYGTLNAEVKEMAARRFSSAVSTELARATPGSDPYALPRVDMYYFSMNNMFKWINTPIFTSYVRCRGALRSIRHGST